MSKRRLQEVRGFVRFPVNSTEYKCSGEGGMFVRLVAIDPADRLEDRWMTCCGGDTFVLYDESYLRDDTRERKHCDVGYSSTKQVLAEISEMSTYDAFHFPHKDAKFTEDVSYLSVPYLAAMTLGSTGWSGYSKEKSAYWHCTYADLTDQGNSLYNLLKKLYAGCDLYLQTWLDT